MAGARSLLTAPFTSSPVKKDEAMPPLPTTPSHSTSSNPPRTFRSVSEVETYLYDAEVQENINELLQRISNDEVLTDIENMIGETRERELI